jgi:hypothetical protein
MGLVSLYEGVAATWVVGDNVFDGNWAEEDAPPRKIARIGFAGSDAVGGHLEVFYGKFKVIDIWNTDTGAMVDEDDMVIVSSKRVCRGGEAIKIILRGAQSGTTPYHLVLDIKDFY